MQRTPKSTEAIFLVLNEAFTLGYRRVEWECDADNVRSNVAAQRLGFTREGLLRQHLVVRDRNHDTVLYSVIDKEWPALERGFTKWLAPENQQPEGQVEKLSA